jgi:hypothetical protein
MIDKIEKKLAMFLSNTLSLGGRLILLNSVLTAMPLYTYYQCIRPLSMSLGK